MYSGCSDKKGGSVVSGFKADDRTQEFIGQFSLPSPRCSSFIKGDFIEYIPGKSLTMAFPVLEDYLNPAQTMQGGIITAAFDNVFGPFCYIESKTGATAAIDINTTYHRPIMAGDVLTVTVHLLAKGRTFIHMTGEAYDSKNRLVATCTTKYMVLDRNNTSHPAAQMS